MIDPSITRYRDDLIAEFSLYTYDGLGDVYGHILHGLVDIHKSLAGGELELFEYAGDRYMAIHYRCALYHAIPIAVDADGIRFFGIAHRRGPGIKKMAMLDRPKYPQVQPLCDPELVYKFGEHILELIGQKVEI